MSVHKKLMEARVRLQAREMKKSGHNKFSGYSYFELGDFLPLIQQIFNDVGLCGVISFTREQAELSITDVEDGTQILITSPMASAELKGCHPIQNLGAVETYQRRYLWMAAMEIVEHDVLDATHGKEQKSEVPKAVSLPKPAAKPVPAVGTLKIPDDAANWVQACVDVTTVALDLCETPEAVMELFKNNRAVFDRLKTTDMDVHDQLMKTFKNVKEALKKNG